MGGDDKYFSLEEVQKHNIARGPDKTIWFVIHDKVYDITKFLDEVKILHIKVNVNVVSSQFIITASRR